MNRAPTPDAVCCGGRDSTEALGVGSPALGHVERNGLKEPLECKRSSPRALPNCKGAAGTLPGLAALLSAIVYSPPPPGERRQEQSSGYLLPQQALGP